MRALATIIGAMEPVLVSACLVGRQCRYDGSHNADDGLLAELERSFDAKRETLLIADHTGLEIEIETLRDRLRRDGLPTGG